jgi:hypothetical protein
VVTIKNYACCLLHADFLLGLLSYPEDGGIFLQNVFCLSLDYTAIIFQKTQLFRSPTPVKQILHSTTEISEMLDEGLPFAWLLSLFLYNTDLCIGNKKNNCFHSAGLNLLHMFPRFWEAPTKLFPSSRMHLRTWELLCGFPWNLKLESFNKIC